MSRVNQKGAPWRVIWVWGRRTRASPFWYHQYKSIGLYHSCYFLFSHFHCSKTYIDLDILRLEVSTKTCLPFSTLIKIQITNSILHPCYPLLPYISFRWNIRNIKLLYEYNLSKPYSPWKMEKTMELQFLQLHLTQLILPREQFINSTSKHYINRKNKKGIRMTNLTTFHSVIPVW